jgi:signal transduction histidine kinase
MSTAAIALAVAGGVTGGLVVFAITTARTRAAERRLLRRLESAFTRISGPMAASVFDAGLRPELAVERIEEAIEGLESSNATALESFQTICKALDEIGVPAAVYDVSGECIYQNRPSRVLSDKRMGHADLKSAADSLVSKSLWSGETLTDLIRPESDDSPAVAVRVSTLDGERKRLGALAVFREVSPTALIDLVEVCRLIASEFEDAAHGRSLALSTFTPPPTASPSRILADPRTLTDAARILVQNSLDVAPPGSVVEIGSARFGEESWLWIADEAPAISERDIEAIFEPDGPAPDLAVVRYLADQMGAELEVVSIEGKGRRFTLRFSSPPPPE